MTKARPGGPPALVVSSKMPRFQDLYTLRVALRCAVLEGLDSRYAPRVALRCGSAVMLNGMLGCFGSGRGRRACHCGLLAWQLSDALYYCAHVVSPLSADFRPSTAGLQANRRRQRQRGRVVDQERGRLLP